MSFTAVQDLIRKVPLCRGQRTRVLLIIIAITALLIYRLKTHCPACVSLESLVWDHYEGPYGDGAPLWMSEASLKLLGWHKMNFVTLTNETLQETIMVTAASHEHFSESLDLIGSIQKHYPQQKLIYFDLGLTDSQIVELKSFCDVIHKTFNFDNYPKHVRNVKNFAWKALIIQEVLHSYNGVLWLDSSIRWEKPWLYIFQNVALRNRGLALLVDTHHSVFATTHEDLYQYFPTNLEKLKEVPMYGAGAILLYRTKDMYKKIIQWWVACSLVPDCIAPISQDHCNFEDGRWEEFANCHRYDQSVINVLAANHFHFLAKNYTPFGTNALVVKHQGMNEFSLKTCP